MYQQVKPNQNALFESLKKPLTKLIQARNSFIDLTQSNQRIEPQIIESNQQAKKVTEIKERSHNILFYFIKRYQIT
ncbi:unnamed protein product [Paramecium sonneborni]|uniref:Uncharacterized protein n=1 Tax=Paramecium sonneborni TaxID=65129 RepID=A0A8S1RE98_9CILI|nr:unnamed protein product [Paramecium sonneborni]